LPATTQPSPRLRNELITPPVGLNLFVINATAPQVPTSHFLLDSLPYVLLTLVGIPILCFVPGIATRLPDQVLGPL
jgi:C4-dicarboxylate transporter, DctM subunit